MIGALPLGLPQVGGGAHVTRKLHVTKKLLIKGMQDTLNMVGQCELHIFRDRWVCEGKVGICDFEDEED